MLCFVEALGRPCFGDAHRPSPIGRCSLRPPLFVQGGRQSRRRASAIRAQSGADNNLGNEHAVGEIPSSLSNTAQQAADASQAALLAGRRRLFIEVNTTGGDETYTLLKQSLPVARLILAKLQSVQSFSDGAKQVVLLPDSGSAALARRDWEQEAGTSGLLQGPSGYDDFSLEHVFISGLDGWRSSWTVSGNSEATCFVIVAPRAGEVEGMERAVDAAGDAPIFILNPDLVDMGVTGMSLTARDLRTRLIDSFEYAYYLKVFTWGVLLRAYPGMWGVWVDDAESTSGFRCIANVESRPSTQELDQLLDSEDGRSGAASGSWLDKFSRFMQTYMKG